MRDPMVLDSYAEHKSRYESRARATEGRSTLTVVVAHHLFMAPVGDITHDQSPRCFAVATWSYWHWTSLHRSGGLGEPLNREKVPRYWAVCEALRVDLMTAIHQRMLAAGWVAGDVWVAPVPELVET
jgi:hypothetical protein